MTNADPDYLNEFLRVLTQASSEILGTEELDSVASGLGARAGQDYLARYLAFAQAVTEKYGSDAGHGIFLRIGRSMMRLLILRFPDESGLLEGSFRTLPKPERLFTGLTLVDRLFWQRIGLPAQVSDKEDHWEWQLEPAGQSLGQADLARLGYFCDGMLQEFMMWSTGGKFYPVTVESQPDHFILKIEKKYIS